MRKAFLFVGIIVWASVATTVSAQDKGQVGVTAAISAGAGESSGSIGVLYHLSKSVALRPTLGYSRYDSEDAYYDSGMGDPGSGSGSTSTQWNAGLAGLFFLTRKDGLATYLGASAAYVRLTDAMDPAPMGSGAGANATQNSVALRAFFGMQYAVAKRFGLYGELGVRYSHSEGQASILRRLDRSSFTTFGGGLGAIFYLR